MNHRTALVERIHDFLASVRLTLFLFGALAITSILGTLIPQAATPEQLLKQYGPKLNALIELLDLADMYHSWWFQVLLVLLAVNLIVCSLRRLPKTLKVLRAGKDYLGASRIQKMHHNAEISFSSVPAETRSRVSPVLDRRFSSCLWREQNGTWQAVAEKGRFGRLGVYLVHASVLIILTGALVGSLFGFRGFVTIGENEVVDHVRLRGTGTILPLDFEIRCDKFHVEFYETGAPKEFRSEVSILEQGEIVEQAAIRVNDPFTYQSVTFYQSTYGTEPSGIVLQFRDLATGYTRNLEVPYREPVTIPGSRDRVVVMDFAENVGNLGPAFHVAVAPENGEPASTWIVVDEPEFHGNRIGTLGISVLEYLKSFYTGLQVKKDPGVWVIYLGFVLMLVSMIIALYVSHRRVWLVLKPAASGTRVLVAGNASKHPLAFAREFQHLVQEVEGLRPDGKTND
jgi:cytochrome c biogenesis protein